MRDIGKLRFDQLFGKRPYAPKDQGLDCAPRCQLLGSLPPPRGAKDFIFALDRAACNMLTNETGTKYEEFAAPLCTVPHQPPSQTARRAPVWLGLFAVRYILFL
jgi:hypothetical protein